MAPLGKTTLMLTSGGHLEKPTFLDNPLIDLVVILFIMYVIYQIIIKSLGFLYYFLVFQIAGLIVYFCKITTVCRKYSRLGLSRERSAVCAWLNFIATFWHSYEVDGLVDKIPDSPCIFVFYHESTVVDLIYFWIKYRKEYPERNLFIIGQSRILGNFWCPAWMTLMEIFNISSATCQDCVEMLDEGNDVCILPGGSSLYGQRDNYQVNWGRRIGFALIAQKTRVPIIPVFTKNIQEAFHTPAFYKQICSAAMVLTAVPVLSGGLPVKLRAYVGDLIQSDDNTTPLDLAGKTADSLRQCIEKNQRLPASKLSAFGERFFCFNATGLQQSEKL